jgi:hypothetical protein
VRSVDGVAPGGAALELSTSCQFRHGLGVRSRQRAPLIAKLIGGVEERSEGSPGWGDVSLEHLVRVRCVGRMSGSFNRHRFDEPILASDRSRLIRGTADHGRSSAVPRRVSTSPSHSAEPRLSGVPRLTIARTVDRHPVTPALFQATSE